MESIIEYHHNANSTGNEFGEHGQVKTNSPYSGQKLEIFCDRTAGGGNNQ